MDGNSGWFALAGVALGGVLEFGRELWARGRDKAARAAAKVEARDNFQRTCLLELQESILSLSTDLAEAMGQEAPAPGLLTKQMLKTGALSQRVFDAEARRRVNDALAAVQAMLRRLQKRGQIETTEVQAFTGALNAAQERIRELLESHF
jgi:predicted secreted protein